ncbi:hypothetical protein KR018_005364 [Drosophila ironensis]|nr:hypothetical protein KR018_005364 [Drosophila ironensis]
MLASIMDTFFGEPADPVRLPLLSSPKPILIILTIYLLLVKVVGPKLMENRKPFDLRGVINAYNIFQIVYNVAMAVFAIHFMFFAVDFNFKCISNLPMDHPYKNWERWLCYSYFANKLIDLMETIFFVLRKKNRQISFLHVFHHTFMVYFSFQYLWSYGYGGHGFLMCFFNVIVHIFMYNYYYQAARDAKASLWWKKYMTIVQLVQFAIVFYLSISTLLQPDCLTARFVAKATAIISLFFFILFSKFYIQNYVLPNKMGNQKEQKTS